MSFAGEKGTGVDIVIILWHAVVVWFEIKKTLNKNRCVSSRVDCRWINYVKNKEVKTSGNKKYHSLKIAKKKTVKLYQTESLIFKI